MVARKVDLRGLIASPDLYEAAVLRYGSERKAASVLGITKSTMHNLRRGVYNAPSSKVTAKLTVSLSERSTSEQKELDALARWIPSLDPTELKTAQKEFRKKTTTRKGKRVTGAQLREKAAAYVAKTAQPKFEKFLGYPVHVTKGKSKRFGRKKFRRGPR